HRLMAAIPTGSCRRRYQPVGDPERVAAISRWLSAATPPVADRRKSNPRGSSTGGIAALSHRLSAAIPLGSSRRRLAPWLPKLPHFRNFLVLRLHKAQFFNLTLLLKEPLRFWRRR